MGGLWQLNTSIKTWFGCRESSEEPAGAGPGFLGYIFSPGLDGAAVMHEYVCIWALWGCKHSG